MVHPAIVVPPVALAVHHIVDVVVVLDRLVTAIGPVVVVGLFLLHVLGGFEPVRDG